MSESPECPCGCMDKPCVAEDLLDLTAYVLCPKDRLVLVQDKVPSEYVAFVYLAIEFHRSPAELKFRAIMERWDQRRIIRELY